MGEPLLKQLEQLTSQSNVLDFDQATALDILKYPQALDLSFWHSRTYNEREILYEKLIKQVTVADGEVVTIFLTV